MLTRLFISLCLTAILLPALAGVTTRVSISSAGGQGNNASTEPSVSMDGRYVTFTSRAANLVDGDTNGMLDVFVRDRVATTTTRVSVTNTGAQSDRDSFTPVISGNGRFIAFTSYASLAGGASNGLLGAYVHDRQTGATERVDVAGSGATPNGNVLYQDQLAISFDGRYVAFASGASNLVTGDTNNKVDVFVRDRQAGTTERVSVGGNGYQADDESRSPALSADGRYVAFASFAGNLSTVDGYWCDIFVRDRTANTTTLVSMDPNGYAADNRSEHPSLSTDGRYVTFASYASNLTSADQNQIEDIFVRDLQTNQTSLISIGLNGTIANNASEQPVISGNGRYVAFRSRASNLVAGDSNAAPDIFVYDRQQQATTRVSVSDAGDQCAQWSDAPAISANGITVAFASEGVSLVSDDSNGVSDVFTREWMPTTVKPDLWLRASTEANYTGDNIYSTDGATQTKARTLAPGGSLSFLFRVQNDGDVFESLRVTGTSGGSGWTVKYYDTDTNAEITSAVIHGWMTGVLPPGASKGFWARVTASSQLPGGAVKALTIRAQSLIDTSVQDVALVTATSVVTRKPDLWIRTASETGYTGDNVYNQTGAGQSKALAINNRVAAIYLVRVQNDGNLADTFTLTANAAGSGWTMVCTDAATGVVLTGALTGAGVVMGPLGPGASQGIMVRLTPGTGVPGGSAQALTFTATSSSDTAQKDVAKAATSVLLRRQPDLWLRANGETLYTGDNIYNLDGSNQSKARILGAATNAIYIFRAQNDGNTAQNLTITGSRGDSDWTVRYYDLATNVNITAQVGGSGWSTGILAPGVHKGFWVQVIPAAATPAGAVCSLEIIVVSAVDTLQKDVVRAVTTR